MKYIIEEADVSTLMKEIVETLGINLDELEKQTLNCIWYT
jgi:hypothetical protein